jgi:hypothetical protein
MRFLFLKTMLCFALLPLALAGCCCFHHSPVVEDLTLFTSKVLRESDYPQSRPLETWHKLQAAVVEDELEWAWNCLSTSTRKNLNFTSFQAGWQFFRDDFYQLYRGKLLQVESFNYSRPAQKMTFSLLGDSKEELLFVEEGGWWFLEFPSPWESRLLWARRNWKK